MQPSYSRGGWGGAWPWSYAYQHWSCEFESLSAQCVQHYVIKFVSDLRQVGGFLRVLRFHFINKTDSHYITEILLKVALNTVKNVGLFLIDIGINCVAHCLLCYCFKFSKVIVLTVFSYVTITGFFFMIYPTNYQKLWFLTIYQCSWNMIIIENVIGTPKVLQFIKKDTGVEYTFRYTL